MYKPTISRTLSTKKGSVESLKCSCRWGCKPKVRQMRWTASLDRPLSSPMVRTDHWVSSSGLVCSVLYTTSATCSSVIDRGAPERSSSYKPLSPFLRKRWRHLPTVARVTPTAAATASLGQPSAASRTISARRTNPCGRLRECAIDANCSRSDSVSSNGANGRPKVIGLSFAKGSQEKSTARRNFCTGISETRQ